MKLEHMLKPILPAVAASVLTAACAGPPQGFVFEPAPPGSGEGVYRLLVDTDGMRYSFLRTDGRPAIEAHATSGIVLHGAPVLSGAYLAEMSADDRKVFSLLNAKGEQGQAEFRLRPNSVTLAIRPDRPSGARIEARLGPIGEPGYGLADHGAAGDVSRIGDIRIENDGGHNRFVSTFTIYPRQRFAQVLISAQDERFIDNTSRNVPHFVSYSSTETSLGVEGASQAGNITYFFGDPARIYREFKSVKDRAGYPDVRPDYRLFGIGWEAWPLLGWNTNAESIRTSVQGFLDRGYPLSWVTVGSGFWEYGGTTTSFGRWNTSPDKYPDPGAFVQWFDNRAIALLMGLRTQFVDGRGVNTGSGRDGSSGEYIDGAAVPPEYTAGLDSGYFARLRNGSLFQSGSGVFPQWDRSLAVLDSTREEAIDWFVHGAARWGSSGWKEDTMLTGRARIYHDGHWNPIMRALHRRGDPVVARNAYVSSPGSVQRLNDTDGEEERIPRLALAYGASGAPNVYADIVGNRDRENGQYIERHAKLQALTATIGLGVEPWRLGDEMSAKIAGALLWRERYRPYFYSAALRAYRTGYPHTLTPLPIGYPDDERVHSLPGEKMWQWTIDGNLLAHPIFDRGNVQGRRDVYLPAGEWMDVNTGEIHTGPKVLASYDYSEIRVPAFVGGSGVLVGRNPATGELVAEIWPIARDGQPDEYVYLHHEDFEDGREVSSTISIVASGVYSGAGADSASGAGSAVSVIEVRTGVRVEHEFGEFGVLRFRISPGHDYEVTDSVHSVYQ